MIALELQKVVKAFDFYEILKSRKKIIENPQNLFLFHFYTLQEKMLTELLKSWVRSALKV